MRQIKEDRIGGWKKAGGAVFAKNRATDDVGENEKIGTRNWTRGLACLRDRTGFAGASRLRLFCAIGAVATFLRNRVVRGFRFARGGQWGFFSSEL